jgi:hypothetical protein
VPRTSSCAPASVPLTMSTDEPRREQAGRRSPRGAVLGLESREPGR